MDTLKNNFVLSLEGMAFLKMEYTFVPQPSNPCVKFGKKTGSGVAKFVHLQNRQLLNDVQGLCTFVHGMYVKLPMKKNKVTKRCENASTKN
jgi:hypothetical protein